MSVLKALLRSVWPTRRAALAGACCFGAAFAIGGLHGNRKFHRLVDDPSVCVSCHHDQPDPSHLLQSETNHSFDFRAPCHVCHVLPTDSFLEFVSEGVLRRPAPAWVEDLGRPVIADQTCMECHLARGRGHIECERCHIDGDAPVHISRNCTLCHQTREPHGAHLKMDCRHCHVATHLDQDERRDLAMERKFRRYREPVEEEPDGSTGGGDEHAR